MQYIPWIISFLSLVVCVLTYLRNGNKDEKAELKEEEGKFANIETGLIKANMKLDQVCTTTNETRTDIKSLNRDLTNLDKRLVIVERDMKTAFNLINEIRGDKG